MTEYTPKSLEQALDEDLPQTPIRRISDNTCDGCSQSLGTDDAYIVVIEDQLDGPWKTAMVCCSTCGPDGLHSLDQYESPSAAVHVSLHQDDQWLVVKQVLNARDTRT